MDYTFLFIVILSMFTGVLISYVFYNLKQQTDDLSYNVLTVKEDLVNVQIKLERITHLLAAE